MTNSESGFSPELKASFGDWIRKNRIKAAIWDFDDFLIDTHKVFDEQIGAFHDYCVNRVPNLGKDDHVARFKGIHNTVYDKMGVSPRSWKIIIDELSSEYGVPLQDGLAFFDDIYTILPPMFEGVKETLEVFQSIGIKQGMLTLAGESWTDYKVDGHGLRPFFDRIKALDPEIHKHKTSEDWAAEVAAFGLKPEEVITGGDNINGDVRAAWNAGVRHVVFAPSNVHWHDEKELPNGIYEIEGVRNLIPTLVTKS